MFTRKSAYETKDDSSDNLDRLTKRFSSDLRGQVKRLTMFKIFSKEWLAMVDELDNLAKIAAMEHQTGTSLTSQSTSTNAPIVVKKRPGSSIIASPSKPNANRQAQKSSSPTSKSMGIPKGTLWEREEYCVRYLVEEAKLGMLVRYIVDFKEQQRLVFDGKLDLKNIATELGVDEQVLVEKSALFEEALGTLLYYLLFTIEALQTCDMHQLIQHIASCLRTSKLIPPTRPFSKTQEYLVLEYLRSIGLYLDQLPEKSILDKIEDVDVIPLTVAFLDRYHGFLTPEELLCAGEAVSLIMDTEPFKTNRDKFLKTDECKKLLISLHSKKFCSSNV